MVVYVFPRAATASVCVVGSCPGGLRKASAAYKLQTEPYTLCACVCYFSILQCNKRGKRARSHADERTGSNAVDGLNVRGLVVRLKMLPEKASALLDRCRRKLHVWLRGEMPPR